MMGLMGGMGSPWMIAAMVVGGVMSLALAAALVFVLIAGGRWLWRQSDSRPYPGAGPTRS